MKYFLIPLALVLILPEEILGQSMYEVYKLDFNSLYEQGNHPVVVASFWDSIGVTVAAQLKKDKYLDWQNRDSIDKKLSALYGNDATAIARNHLNSRIKLMGASDQELREEFKVWSARAKQTFEILGAKNAQKVVLDQLFHSLAFMHHKENFLQHIDQPAFALALGLSEQQQEKIVAIKKQVAQDFRNSPSQAKAAIRIELDRVWGELLESMNDEEKKKVEMIVGQPTDWYLELNPLQYQPTVRRRQQVNSTPICVWGTELPSEPDANGKYVDQYTDEELAKAGFTRVDKFLIKLLSWSPCREALKLDSSQVEQLETLLDYFKRRAIGETVSDQTRREELQSAQQIRYHPELTKILTDEQLKSLRWIELQARPYGQSNYIATTANLFASSHPVKKIASQHRRSTILESLYGNISTKPGGFNKFRATNFIFNFDLKAKENIQAILNEKVEAMNSMSKQIQDVLTEKQKQIYMNLLDRNWHNREQQPTHHKNQRQSKTL